MNVARLVLAGALLAGCGPGVNGEEAAGRSADARAETGAPAAPEQQLPARGTAWVIFGADTVTAEVARTNEERARGLMFRDEVPDGTGMLFVFAAESPQSFWMQDTYVALDIAFINAAFEVVDIQQMEPLTTETHDSTAPAMYALEVRKGWFAEHGIAVGARPEIVFGG